MSMLASKDNEKPEAILEIVDALRQHGAAAKADMERFMWRRLVFNILISNTDDHLRNHGFSLRGRRRAGACRRPTIFNPVPTDIKPRILGHGRSTRMTTPLSLPLAMEVAGYFELEDGKGPRIAKQVGKAVSKWRDEGRAARSDEKTRIERMASAFEHEDLKAASPRITWHNTNSARIAKEG